LEGKIDPAEWRKEQERVYQDLDNIEKDIEINKQRGTALIPGGTFLEEEIEEYRRHIEMIVELCKDIKGTCHADVRKVFAKVAEKLEDDLSFIRKHEIRINQNNLDAITQLNKITTGKKQIALELRSLIDIVKHSDFNNKDLSMKINQINNRFEELAADANGEKQLSRVKSAVVRIKKEIKDTSLTEGVM
jgi:Intra-flagellar transport protein 57